MLLIYDYLITFDREVDLFWASTSLTAAPILFYTTRYLGLLSTVLTRMKAIPGLSLEVRVTVLLSIAGINSLCAGVSNSFPRPGRV